MKLFGKKLYMTAVYDTSRNQVPVTALEIGPCYVTQIKTRTRDGYDAVQIGYRETKETRLTKPQQGHLKKAGAGNLARLGEFRTGETVTFKTGDALSVDLFAAGERVDVHAHSKGRGFTGVVKRYSFKGGPKTHGQSDRHRTGGSIGAGSDPSRVIKGVHMAGQHGNKRITIKNLEVVRVFAEKNIMLVKGSVPGSRNTIVEVTKR